LLQQFKEISDVVDSAFNTDSLKEFANALKDITGTLSTISASIGVVGDGTTEGMQNNVKSVRELIATRRSSKIPT